MRRLRPALVVLAAGIAAPAAAQDLRPLAPPPPPANALNLDELPRLADRLVDRVRLLAEALEGEPGRDPRALRAQADALELVQTAEEFADQARRVPDPGRLPRGYGGFAVGWRNLRGEITGGAGNSREVERAVARVDEVDAEISRTLGVYAPGPAPAAGPDGTVEARRYSRALAARAAALSAAVHAEAEAQAVDAALIRDADDLARAAESYRNLIDAEQLPVDRLPDGFAPIDELTVRFERRLSRWADSPRGIRAAWSEYRPISDLVRRQIGYGPPPGPIAGPGPLPPPGTASVPVPAPVPVPDRRVVFRPVLPGPQVEQLSGVLIEQVDAFLQVFGPTVGVVPEGERFFADAQQLRAAAIDFNQAAQAGLDVGQLAARFGPIDAITRRLSRRTARIAKGRTGPNIQQIGLIGQTVAQLGAELGDPSGGFPPAYGFPGFDR